MPHAVLEPASGVTVLRIAFAGTPEFALPALRGVISAGHRIVGVLTQPDRPKGRGQRTAPSPVKQAALEHGLPVSQPATLRRSEGRAELLAWHPDVLVVVAYGLILPPEVLRLPRLGCVNIHASLLPRWRGAAPIQRAILAGDTESGITIMLMDEGLDTGPILAQRRLRLGAGATSGTLHDALAELGATVLLEVLPQLAAGSVRAEPQPAEGVMYAAKIDKAEALIDWRDSATALERKVRAFNPWPVAQTRWDGEPLRVLSAGAEPGGGRAAPGTIIAVRADAILVSCGQDCLAVTQLQRPGRKPVSARDFANAGLAVGTVLG